MKNIIKLNDWSFKSCLIIIIVIQLLLWAVIGLDALQVKVPILRQFIGFIYLIYIPGNLILRILRLHKLDNVETLLYSVGLSAAALMFLGASLNSIYPILIGPRPISFWPLMVTISIFIAALCLISYSRDRDFSDPDLLDSRFLSSPSFLFSCLIPIWAILGAYLVNVKDNNIIIYILLTLIIPVFFLLLASGSLSIEALYPFAILAIAISLLFHASLISDHLWGWDIYTEHRFADMVITNSIWDRTISNNVNSMLSVVMLAPIISIICDIDLTWVFKIIYPLLFSLVPLGLYRIFQRQTNDRVAFLSCFFFMSQYMFFSEMLSLGRQEVAELFLVLLVLAILGRNVDRSSRSILILILSASLIVSHYGVSYIFAFFIIAAWLILYSNILGRAFKDNRASSVYNAGMTVNSNMVLLFILLAFTWYNYNSASLVLNTFVNSVYHIVSSLTSDFLNPMAAQGLDIILTTGKSPMREVAKYLHLITQFFIFLGVIAVLLDRKTERFQDEFMAFSLISLVLCLAGIFIPYLAIAFNASRLYQISLVFLAPFCIVGFQKFLDVASDLFSAIPMNQRPWTSSKVPISFVLPVFLIAFFLFNTGVVYELTGEPPSSISLSSDEFTYFFGRESDEYGVKWLSDADQSGPIYGDYFEVLTFIAYTSVSENQINFLRPWTIMPDRDYYIYVRAGDALTQGRDYLGYETYGESFISYMDKIYNNVCIIYKK